MLKQVEQVYKYHEIEYDDSRDNSCKSSLNELRAIFMREISIECEFW